MTFLLVFIHLLFAFSFFLLKRPIEASLFFLWGLSFLFLFLPSSVKIFFNSQKDGELDIKEDKKPSKISGYVQYIQNELKNSIFLFFWLGIYALVYGIIQFQYQDPIFIFLSIFFFISFLIVVLYFFFFQKQIPSFLFLFGEIQGYISILLLIVYTAICFYKNQIVYNNLLLLNTLITPVLLYINIKSHRELNTKEQQRFLTLFLFSSPYIFLFLFYFFSPVFLSFSFLFPLTFFFFSLIHFFFFRLLFPQFQEKIFIIGYFLWSIAFLYSTYLFFFTNLTIFSLSILFIGFIYYSLFHWMFQQEISCLFSTFIFYILYAKIVLLNTVLSMVWLVFLLIFIPSLIFIGLFVWKKDFFEDLRNLYLYLSFFSALVLGWVVFYFHVIPLQVLYILIFSLLIFVLAFTLFFLKKYS